MLDLRARTVLLIVGGSRAYGTFIDSSDVDLKGCCVPPARVLHGFLERFEQVDDAASMEPFRALLRPEEQVAALAHGLEGTVYDVRKLMSLALQANPNILDVLFCRDAEVRVRHPLGERLRQHRDGFLSARARQTFAGYAAAQLKRIRNHRAWLLSPPAGAPTREQHGLPDAPLVQREHLLAAEAAIRKQVDRWEVDLDRLDEADAIYVRGQIERTLAELGAPLGLGAEDATWLSAARTVGLAEDLIEALRRERGYRSAQAAWRAYEQWREHRNPERAALEAAHGYDTKHAAHLVRLLRMAGEILTTGKVHVWRGPGGADDADELLAIRAGTWSYDELVDWADTTNNALDGLVATGGLAVPTNPDREAIDQLCVELVEEGLAVL